VHELNSPGFEELEDFTLIRIHLGKLPQSDGGVERHETNPCFFLSTEIARARPLRMDWEVFPGPVGAEIAVSPSNYVVVDVSAASREQCKDPAGDG
jgi:hypothetical protein